MAECGKKDTCKNYDKKCSQCWASSSIYDTHPCYTSKDLVEVVRCKDCAYRRVPARCSLWMGTIGENDYFREHGDNFYCAFGALKERGGEK